MGKSIPFKGLYIIEKKQKAKDEYSNPIVKAVLWDPDREAESANAKNSREEKTEFLRQKKEEISAIEDKIKDTDNGGKQAEENKMGVMPMNKLIINVALPMILSMFVQACYNIVDRGSPKKRGTQARRVKISISDFYLVRQGFSQRICSLN